MDFPILKYADDTLLIMEASQQQLFSLKAMIHIYDMVVGLKVNYTKSSIIPINVTPDKMKLLASTLNYHIDSLPFTYRLPFIVLQPKLQVCLPLINRIQSRLENTLFFE